MCGKKITICPGCGLVQTGKFAEVVKQVDTSKHQLDLDFELAQVLYRLEQYGQFYSAYKDLIKSLQTTGTTRSG